jgi:hypothetical protein
MELVVPQALGGWALLLGYGSTISPGDDRTALPDDIVASIGAGVALQPNELRHAPTAARRLSAAQIYAQIRSGMRLY